MPSQRPVVESPGVRLRIPSEYRLIEADDGRLLLSCGTHFVDVRASFGRKGVAAAIDRPLSSSRESVITRSSGGAHVSIWVGSEFPA